MPPKELMPSAMDGNHTIDLLIKTVNRLYKDIQLQDAYQDTDEGVMEEHAPEHMMLTSRSTGGETLRNIITSELPTIDESRGRGLQRVQSAPPRNLPDPVIMIRKLQGALRRLKRNLKYMKSLQSDVEMELNKQYDSLSLVVEEGVEPSETLNMGLQNVTKKLLDLISKVPVPLANSKKKEASPNYQDGYGVIQGRVAYLPGIHVNEEDLKRLAVFRDVRDKFTKLATDRQICLLSFGVFPENQGVNRTMLMYWWIGEGILPDGVKPEDAVKDILKDFMEKKLIEPVENKRKVEPNSYKMTPFVHSSVVLISEEIGLFNMYQKGKKPTMNKSRLKKVLLVEGSSSQPEAKAKKMPAMDIETVFNISERFPDFTCKWFSRTKVLKVLYLGRWERTERDIEVDSRRVMIALSCMSKLRFLSLQGISTIKSLSRSACNLTELILLDLRGCYNLEKLPEDIHKLKNLVYLDLTGCEALESIPVGLARLVNLEVLKGFVVTDDREIACKLIELKRLLKLRKLSVTIDREDFGCGELIRAILGLNALEKLKVQWGSESSLSMKQRNDAGRILASESTSSHGKYPRWLDASGRYQLPKRLPKQLRKLDLQRFPDSKLPDWLLPQNLISLETLHLGSSRRLKEFGALPETPTDCGLKVLRLMCLPKLRVEWRELTQLYFPKLRLLESYECPRVTFCPCDADGIWRSDK